MRLDWQAPISLLDIEMVWITQSALRKWNANSDWFGQPAKLREFFKVEGVHDLEPVENEQLTQYTNTIRIIYRCSQKRYDHGERKVRWNRAFCSVLFNYTRGGQIWNI